MSKVMVYYTRHLFAKRGGQTGIKERDICCLGHSQAKIRPKIWFGKNKQWCSDLKKHCHWTADELSSASKCTNKAWRPEPELQRLWEPLKWHQLGFLIWRGFSASDCIHSAGLNSNVLLHLHHNLHIIILIINHYKPQSDSRQQHFMEVNVS